MAYHVTDAETFYEITILLINSLILCIEIMGGKSFFAKVPQYSTVYFVFSQIWNSNFNTLRSLSRYHFNIKTVNCIY